MQAMIRDTQSWSIVILLAKCKVPSLISFLVSKVLIAIERVVLQIIVILETLSPLILKL